MHLYMWKVIAGVVVVLIAGSIWYSSHVSNRANEGVAVTPHVKGNPDAEVVLVEYSDFQCPACKQFAPVVDRIVSEYEDSLRFEYRHFPLIGNHPNAVPAAIAAEAAAQQGEFFRMHDILFERQQEWASAAAPNALFKEYAAEVGLDTELFARHLDSSLLRDTVEESFEDARERNFSGTPTFLLNGEEMQFQTFSEFEERIVNAIGANVSGTTTPATTTDEGLQAI